MTWLKNNNETMKVNIKDIGLKTLTEKEQMNFNGGVVCIVLGAIALAITATTAIGYTVGRLTKDN